MFPVGYKFVMMMMINVKSVIYNLRSSQSEKYIAYSTTLQLHSYNKTNEMH